MLDSNLEKRAFITGIYGQDGSYLAELLLGRGYTVFGIAHSKSNANYAHEIEKRCMVFYGDMEDRDFLKNCLKKGRPDELYNFAGVSDLATAWAEPEKTQKVNYEAVGVLFSEAVLVNPNIRIFQASSSQMFDLSTEPQTEESSFVSRNPYAEAKIKAHKDWVVGLREKGHFVCSGFLYNHESPRRDERFVTRKITRSLVRIVSGIETKPIELGNIDNVRDWSFAGDFVEAAHMMLQAPKPNDYIIASGSLHSVREFLNESARVLGLVLKWEGEVTNESAVDQHGRTIVVINKDFYNPTEVEHAVGDISRIKKDLGWQPKVSFNELVDMMVKYDQSILK
jgi:GDPmannose 4,6-dehydratase